MNKLRLQNGQEVELPDDRVYCNNIIFPWEYNPHNVRLWVIHEVGPLCAVWAESEQDALDEMLDQGIESFLVSEEDFAAMTDEEKEELAYLGNASEPCDLTYAWLSVVKLEAEDYQLIAKLAEARGLLKSNLDY